MANIDTEKATDPAATSAPTTSTMRFWRWFLAFLGFGGILGGWLALFSNSTTLWDKLYPPSLELTSLKPICIFENVPDPDVGTFTLHGIGIIAHVQNGRRELPISAVDIEGMVGLSYDEYLIYFNKSYHCCPKRDRFFRLRGLS